MFNFLAFDVISAAKEFLYVILSTLEQAFDVCLAQNKTLIVNSEMRYFLSIKFICIMYIYIQNIMQDFVCVKCEQFWF